MLYKKSLSLIRIKEAGFVLRKKCFLCRKSDYRKLILLPIIWIIPSENFSRFCKESLSYDDTPFGFKMQASFMFFWKKNPKKFFLFFIRCPYSDDFLFPTFYNPYYNANQVSGGVHLLAEQDRRTAKRAGKAGRSPEICSRVMLVRILGTDREEPYGDIVHPNLRQPVPYQSLAQLSISIDRIARYLKLTDGRNTFHPSEYLFGEDTVLPEEYRGTIPEGQWSEGACQEPERKKMQEIVSVEVIGGNHRSLQGRIQGRLTGGRYRYFCSVLDLMYLFMGMQQKKKKLTEKTERLHRDMTFGEVSG